MIVLPAGLVEFHLRAQLIEPLPKVFILQFDWDPSHATQAWDCKSIILTQFLKLKLNKFSIHLLKLLSPRRLMTIFKNFFHSTKYFLYLVISCIEAERRDHSKISWEDYYWRTSCLLADTALTETLCGRRLTGLTPPESQGSDNALIETGQSKGMFRLRR